MEDLMEFLWRRRPCIFHSVVILWIAAFIRISDSCSSRPVPKIRSPPALSAPPPQLPVPAGQGGLVETTTVSVNATTSISHYACPGSYQKWYCLNGASCFMVKIGETILYNCRCSEGYMGQRCEYKDTDENYGYVRTRYIVKTASIAGGVTLGVIILVVAIVAIMIAVRRRKSKENAALGTAPPSLSRDQLLRSPFGRAGAQAKDFRIGRPWSPVSTPGALSLTIRPPNNPSTEQQALLEQRLQPLRRAPRASTSDTSLSAMDLNARDDVIITLPDLPVSESPHPYNMAANNGRRTGT